MLERYVYLVKNLRGVLATAPTDELGGIVDWLAKRFRYRDLGVPSCLVEREPSAFQERLGGAPFHALGYPTERVHRAATMILEELSQKLDRCLAESLLLAAAYASPLHLTPAAIEELDRAGIVVHIFHGKKMDDRMAKLHMRIVDYTVLDYYVETIRDAVDCIKNPACTSETLREKRRRQALEDEKRYWRLRGGDTPVIAYIDYASTLVDKPWADRLAGPEERVLLPLLAGINITARQ